MDFAWESDAQFALEMTLRLASELVRVLAFLISYGIYYETGPGIGLTIGLLMLRCEA